MGHTCNSFIAQSSNVYLRLEEASGPPHLVSLADINMALKIRLKRLRRAGMTLKALMFHFSDVLIFRLWCFNEHVHSRARTGAETFGLRCTYSFIFMAFINLPIYFSGTQCASLWLTYCSVLGNMGPEEWGLAYSCLIDVNKKCRVFLFFLFLDAKSPTHYTVNLTQGVRINSKESCNLWKNEISPHLQKLPRRIYHLQTKYN